MSIPGFLNLRVLKQSIALLLHPSPRCPENILLPCGEPSSQSPVCSTAQFLSHWLCHLHLLVPVGWSRLRFCEAMSLASASEARLIHYQGHYWVGPNLYSLMSLQGHTRLQESCQALPRSGDTSSVPFGVTSYHSISMKKSRVMVQQDLLWKCLLFLFPFNLYQRYPKL